MHLAYKIIRPLLRKFVLASTCFLISTAVLAQKETSPPPLDWEDCPSDMAYRSSLNAQCLTLSPPLDYKNPDKDKIKLFIARYPAQFDTNKGAPIFLLAGGPGQAGSDSFPSLMPALKPLRRNHDLILIDQRGTGLSEELSCPQPDLDGALEMEKEDIAKYTQECLDNISIDPRFFTSWEAANDLDFIRKALNQEHIILFGVSYGTRLATTYMRYFTSHVEKAILDGIVPVGEPLGLSHHINLQRALELIITSCEEQKDCSEKFPDLHKKLMALPGMVGEDGIELTIRNPYTHEKTEYTLDDSMVRLLIRLYAYSPEQVALLPWLIDQAYDENWNAFAAQGLMIAEQLGDSISGTLQNSVMCTEDFPLYRSRDTSSTFMDSEIIYSATELCKHWPTGYLGENFREPLNIATPTLLLSGEWDPVTPPSFADILDQDLINSRHLIAAGQGHFILPRGCTAQIAQHFLDDTELGDLDITCLDKLRAPDFFMNANGPAMHSAASEESKSND